MAVIRNRLLTFIVLFVFITANIKISLKRKFSRDNNKLIQYKALSKLVEKSKINPKFLTNNFDNLGKKWDKYNKKYEAISLTNTSEIEVKNYFSLQYNADIFIGTPPQIIEAELDTGSSDLWSFTYNPNQSETFVNLTENYQRAYGQGSEDNLHVNGYLGLDTVTFGEYTLKNYKFAVITEHHGGKDIPSNFAIIGLSTIFLSITGATPLVQEFYNQGYIEKPVFSFYLTEKINGTGSVLVLGEADPNYYIGEINYFNLIIKAWWEIEIEGFELYGQLLPYKFAFLDTGAGNFFFPTDYFKKIVNILDNNSGDPEAAVIIENQKFPIVKERMNKHWILSSDVNFIVLGDPFISLYYTVFDYENYRIGIAQLNPNLQ